MDILAIRQALAAVVEGVTGRCYSHPTRSPNAPCGVIAPAEGEFIDYLQAMHRGLVAVNFRVILLASLGDDEGTAKISSWLSTGTGTSSSVPDALAGATADKTLGGLVGDLVVRRAENAGWIPIPPDTNNWFASAEIAVDISLPQ